MRYEVRFARIAERNFDAAPVEIRTYVAKYVESLVLNPRPHDAIEVEAGTLHHQGRNCAISWVLVETNQPPIVLVSVILAY